MRSHWTHISFAFIKLFYIDTFHTTVHDVPDLDLIVAVDTIEIRSTTISVGTLKRLIK